MQAHWYRIARPHPKFAFADVFNTKKNISTFALSRHRGISYNLACFTKQKIMHAFLQTGHHDSFAGAAHTDNGYLGGKHQDISGHDPTPPTWLLLSKEQTCRIQPYIMHFENLPTFKHLSSPRSDASQLTKAPSPLPKDQAFQKSNITTDNFEHYLLDIYHAIQLVAVTRYIATLASNLTINIT